MSSWTVNHFADAPPAGAPSSFGPWRPPQWKNKQLTSVTASLPNSDSASGSTPTTYFFDAVLRTMHDQQLHPTRHPVQSGANISDHAFMLPAKVTLEVAFSDAMAVFQQGQYTSDISKSISAYQTFLKLQKLRVPLTVRTRLKTYENMVVTDVSSPDDVRTLHGARVTLTFEELITATTVDDSGALASARPSVTGDTGEGVKVPEDTSSTVSEAHVLTDEEKQEVLKAVNSITPNSYIKTLPVNVPGAGDFSSNNASTITTTGPQ